MIIMRPQDINGKKVYDSDARELGSVYGIEFDITGWNLTHICVDLNTQTIEALNYKKPRFVGRIVVDLPVEYVKAVGDAVALNTSIDELKTVLEAH
jgi:sporulation protein YlmC with PRC-barrel domain